MQAIKIKGSKNFLRYVIIVGIFLMVILFLCAILWNFRGKEISLFDVPGMKTNSLRYSYAERMLNLVTVNEAMVEKDLLKSCYPTGEIFYISERLPITIVERNGVVDVVRVGCAFMSLRESESSSYVLTPTFLKYIATNLEKTNVRLSYELIVATNVESAISAFWRPYVVGPSRFVQGDLVRLDFHNVEAPDYWPIVLYYVRDELVGFEISSR